jgi:hypothetical protein
MRNLENKITEWRSRMAAGGIKAPAVLDELESHLREDIERQMRGGVDEAAAFETAVKRIGRSELLKPEFAKVGKIKEWPLGRVIGAGCCVFALLYSMILAPGLFTIHELSSAQRIQGISAVAFTLLSIISWRFSYKYLPIIRSRRARTVAVAAFALAGVAWLLIFANLLPEVIVPRAMHDGASAESIRGSALIGLRHATEGEFRAVFTIGLSLLWAMTLAAVLGAAAYGLEETARRRAKENVYV